MKRLSAGLVLLVLLFGSFPRHAPVLAAPGPPIRLSVVLPQHRYPRNALVQVIVRMHNETPHVVELRATCGDNPLVEVLAPQHNIVYPTSIGIQSCPATFLTRLAPYQVAIRRLFIVLRGPQLLPVVLLGDRRTVTGPVLPLQLYRQAEPQVVVHAADPMRTAIEIRPRGPVHGPLYYSDSYVCQADSNPRTILQARVESAWFPAHGTRIMPHWPSDCPAPEEWHVVAGWLGGPVATFTYPNV